MKRVKLQIICLAMTTGMFSLSEGALAKTASNPYHLKKKPLVSKKTAPEVYPALESDEGTPISSSSPKPNAAERISPPTQLAQDRPTLPPNSKVQPFEKPRDYDVVPEQLSTPLIRRLQLVQILVQKYNRAYDYRTRTTAELEKILIDLDFQHRQPVVIPQQVSLAPEIETSDGDAAKESDPLFSGNAEEAPLLETLPDLPPPNPA